MNILGTITPEVSGQFIGRLMRQFNCFFLHIKQGPEVRSFPIRDDKHRWNEIIQNWGGFTSLHSSHNKNEICHRPRDRTIKYTMSKGLVLNFYCS